MAIERVSTRSITAAAASEALDLSSLRIGQAIEARVLAIVTGGLARLLTPGGMLDAKMPLAVVPGDRLRLEVAATQPDLTLRLTALSSDAADPLPAATIDPATLKAAMVLSALPRLGSAPDIVRTPPTISGTVAPEMRASLATAASTASDTQIVPRSAASTAPPAAAPAEALAGMLRGAIAGQTGLAPLFADAARFLASPAAGAPAPLLAMLGRLLETRLPAAQAADTASLAAAFARAAPNAEALLANGQPLPQEALKPLLLALKAELGGWLGTDAEPLRRAAHPPPPARSGEPAGQPPADAADLADAQGLGRLLLGDVEGALDRIRLLQYASLPDPAAPAGAARDPSAPLQWTLEIPIRFGQETAVAGFRIDRDGGREGTDPAEKRWQIRFGMDLEPLGTINAHLVLIADRVSLTLRAERREALDTFRGALATLRDALTAASLTVTDLNLLEGIEHPPPGRPGLSLDRSA